MKYYISELWRKLNSNSSKEREEAKYLWKNNDEEYSKIFEKVKERLPKKFLKIFMREHGFHDYKLRNFQVIHVNPGYKDPIEILITITNGETTWNIMYYGIKEFNVKYTSKPMLFPGKMRVYYDGFDDYGYDEFYEIDENTLSHEILFASGATIFICFNKISISKIE